MYRCVVTTGVDPRAREQHLGLKLEHRGPACKALHAALQVLCFWCVYLKVCHLKITGLDQTTACLVRSYCCNTAGLLCAHVFAPQSLRPVVCHGCRKVLKHVGCALLAES